MFAKWPKRGHAIDFWIWPSSTISVIQEQEFQYTYRPFQHQDILEECALSASRPGLSRSLFAVLPANFYCSIMTDWRKKERKTFFTLLLTDWEHNNGSQTAIKSWHPLDDYQPSFAEENTSEWAWIKPTGKVICHEKRPSRNIERGNFSSDGGKLALSPRMGSRITTSKEHFIAITITAHVASLVQRSEKVFLSACWIVENLSFAKVGRSRECPVLKDRKNKKEKS